MRGAFLLIGTMLTGPALAQPAAPPSVAVAIQDNVATARARASADEVAFAPLGNPAILDAKRRQNAAQAQASLIAIVLEAISANPQNAEAIVAEAARAAPENATAVRAAAASYFPGYFGAAQSQSAVRPAFWYDAAPVSRPAAPPVAPAAIYVSAGTVMPTSWYGQANLAGYGMGTMPTPMPSGTLAKPGPVIDAPASSGVWDPIEPVTVSYTHLTLPTNREV